MAGYFITNRETLLSDIISGILPKTDAVGIASRKNRSNLLRNLLEHAFAGNIKHHNRLWMRTKAQY